MDLIFDIATKIDSFVICSITLYITYLYTFKYIVASKLPTKYLTVTVAAVLLQALMEIMNIIFSTIGVPENLLFLMKISYSFTFTLCVSLSMFLSLFSYEYMLMGMKYSDIHKKLIVFPIILDIFLYIYNYFSGFAFTVSSDGALVRESFYALHYILIFIDTLILFMVVIKRHKGLPKNKKILFLMEVSIVLFLGIVVELVFNIDTFISPINCLSLSLILVFLRTTHTSLDSLTKIANLSSFKNKLKELDDAKKNYTLVLMDIDDLGEINNSYGYQEGNIALKTFTRELKKQCKEPNFIASCDSDEFIMCFTKASENEINELLLKLSSNLRSDSLSNGKNYTISYMYTIGKHNSDSDQTSHELMQEMLLNLYKLKCA